ncbi:ATP synthase subunit alpha [compost metagenome]
MPEQIFCLIALSSGLLDGKQPAEIRKFRTEILDFVRGVEPQTLAEVESTKKLTEEQKKRFADALRAYFEQKAD